MAKSHKTVLNELAIRALDAPEAALGDAMALGRLLAVEAPTAPDDIDYLADPPDGVKLTMTRGERRLTLFCFGDRRLIFGKTLLSDGSRQGEGEISLSESGKAERLELFAWLAGVNPP